MPGRGPLALRVLRLLGLEGWQAWASASEPSLARAFGQTGGNSVRPAWLASRVLPTPLGHYRASIGPSWPVDPRD